MICLMSMVIHLLFLILPEYILLRPILNRVQFFSQLIAAKQEWGQDHILIHQMAATIYRGVLYQIF